MLADGPAPCVKSGGVAGRNRQVQPEQALEACGALEETRGMWARRADLRREHDQLAAALLGGELDTRLSAAITWLAGGGWADRRLRTANDR